MISCSLDRTCVSGLCLPDGTCAAAGSVLYAASTATGASCAASDKCSLTAALDMVTATRNVIVLDPGSYPGGLALSHSVQIIGQGATLQAPSAGSVVTVTGNGIVELDYLAITGAAADSGIVCSSGALVAHAVRISANQLGITSGCQLTLDRSMIGNNTGGALAISAGQIAIRNNFIVGNGSDMLKKAANVTIASGVTGAFEFNTVAFNQSKKNGTPGIDCESSMITGPGNLITDNYHNTAAPLLADQVIGSCDFAPSYITAGTGTNDLGWVNPAAGNFHLTAASTPVIDQPGLSCAGQGDVDGEVRPLGTGCDFGADEFNPTPSPAP